MLGCILHHPVSEILAAQRWSAHNKVQYQFGGNGKETETYCVDADERVVVWKTSRRYRVHVGLIPSR